MSGKVGLTWVSSFYPKEDRAQGTCHSWEVNMKKVKVRVRAEPHNLFSN